MCSTKNLNSLMCFGWHFGLPRDRLSDSKGPMTRFICKYFPQCYILLISVAVYIIPMLITSIVVVIAAAATVFVVVVAAAVVNMNIIADCR